MATGLLLLLSFSDAADAQPPQQQQQQPAVAIRNTARQIKPGLYECVIYVEASPEMSGIIDDVTYTLPPGFPVRKQKKHHYPYRSDPFNASASEEVIVNVKIDYKGRDNAYFSYKLTFDRR
jgi:hypothetical protein